MIQTDNPPIPFSNKVETLLYLKDKLSASYILDLYSFSVFEYRENPKVIISSISSLFSDEVIIRSSASTEDRDLSNAGHFSSIQHVNSQISFSVSEGIETVIRSYEKDGLASSEIIFVQRQLSNVMLSGVALSYDPDNGKPYFLVNYDDSGSTDSVTSGKCKQHMYIARDYYQSNCLESKLCYALLEVEKCCNESSLNVEFAITNDGKIFVLQVRYLKMQVFHGDFQVFTDRKNSLVSNYTETKELLSDMAFWNPSEIIGDAPHPLDLSLYSFLVTDHAWNIGIAEMGYFSTAENLMTNMGNKPYIKLKAAFLALTPSFIDDKLREKLKNYYCELLLKNEVFHDKIEFEVVHTCYDFSTQSKLLHLSDSGFEDEEIDTISTALFQMTKTIIEEYDVVLNKDMQKLTVLENLLTKCKKQNDLNSVKGIIATIIELMPIIRDFGIVPFARQARCAFIARSICLSLVNEGKISSEELDAFMLSVDTISSEMHADIVRCKNGELSRQYIMSKYGHLRLNTYDISSPTYEEMGFERVFDDEDSMKSLKAHNLGISTSKFLVNYPKTQIDLANYTKKSIAQREYFKFIFTGALSFVLEVIAKLGQELGFTRSDFSFLSIEDIFELNLDYDSQLKVVEIINSNKQNYEIDAFLTLPSVISKPEDFNVIRVSESLPNFITNKCVEGDILVLDNYHDEKPDVSDKIVVIQNADPGFDWIFASGSLAGLITKYGGMASHMAIRCMEFGVPAAIGCGELIYNRTIQCKRLSLNCLSKKVVIN